VVIDFRQGRISTAENRVEALAAVLLEKKTLSGEEIANLIEATMSGKCAQLSAVPANRSSPLVLSLSA
jgi:hypothetical protein